MSNYSAPITATGSLINFDAPFGGVFDSLSVPITPTQDFHGYSKPWPAGGGANKFGVSDATNISSGSNKHLSVSGELMTVSASGTVYSSAIVTSAALSSVIRDASIPDGTYIFKVWDFATNVTNATLNKIRLNVSNNGTTVAVSPGSSITVTNGTFLSVASSSSLSWSNGKYISFRFSVTLTNVEEWTPYENICPITGSTGLSAYVGPTNQQAQATEYAISFGATVYAGSVNPITGKVKARPYYASYNGETLTGPWMSSMDEYAAGATPTTGAQVVDLGGALSTASITPVDISMREGSNYVWVDTGAVITLVYRLLQVDRQTGATSIGKNAESLLVSKQFGAYSKVVINVTAELYYESGNDTGRTLTLDCPWGTQAMADNILATLEGYQYQPFEAQNAIIDPAAELGDGLTVNGVYGGIFKLTIRSGVLHSADVSSPQDEEIEHEYKFTPAAERKIERRINNMESELSVQADQISAKVDRQGGDPSSVSWTMDSDVFKVQADGNDVLTIDENGLTVNGDGTFTGSVQAKNIAYGGSNGTFSGGGISGHSISSYQLGGGINTSLGNADYSADVFSGAAVAMFTKAKNLYCVGKFLYNGTEFTPAVYNLLDQNYNVVRLRVLKS